MQVHSSDCGDSSRHFLNIVHTTYFIIVIYACDP